MTGMRPDLPATPPSITTIVFDLGGVLIDWDPRHLYRQMFSDPQEMEVFLRDVVSPDWNAEQDSGRTWAEATALLLEEHPEHEPMITAYVERWDEMLAGPIEGTVAILEEVRDAGLRIYALTNWSAETFPRARLLFPFLEWFEGIVVSGDEGIRKPTQRSGTDSSPAMPSSRRPRSTSMTCPTTRSPPQTWDSRRSGSRARSSSARVWWSWVSCATDSPCRLRDLRRGRVPPCVVRPGRPPPSGG